jgi:hypothetical protein
MILESETFLFIAGVVVHASNPSTQEGEARIVSSRPGWATKRNPVSKKRNTPGFGSDPSSGATFTIL